MRSLGAVSALLLAALGACAPGDTWSSRVEEPPYMPPPPEHLLRKPADFRIFDAHVRKEFFLYVYEDESVNEEVITVINYALPDSSRAQRLATRDEADFAMGLFIADWKSRGQEDRIQYFNRRHAEEMYRKSTQLDDQIEHMKNEKKWWDTQAFNLECDLQSRQNTGAYAGGDEKFNLAESGAVQKQLTHAKRLQVLAEANLAILEYKRAIRDSQYARAGAVFVESSIRVDDLLPNYGQPERLVDDVRSHVQPFAWGLSEVRLQVVEGKLMVRHTRDVVLMVRDYVEELRAQFQAKAQMKGPAPAKP
ncbi:MAG TPA: hypothetical protein VEN81_14070 [Planctomycetota bacterium]|jgi:hypothetical protein|nr:hypothetical protein [Planctomycetota bacterium]